MPHSLRTGVERALELTRAAMTNELRRLVRARKLAVVGRVRGETTEGSLLLIPHWMIDHRDALRPSTPLTWLEYVISGIEDLLKGRSLDVGKSLAFSTEELRAHLRMDCPDGSTQSLALFGQCLDKPMTVTYALQRLSAGSSPFVQSLPDRRSVWCRVSDIPAIEDSQLLFAKDADRIIEAARRSVSNSEMLTFTLADITRELSLDASLVPVGRQKANQILSELAKEQIDHGNRRRVVRRAQLVRRVGSIANTAIYWVQRKDATNDFTAARQSFMITSLRGAVESHQFERRIADLEIDCSPAILEGRVRGIMRDLGQMRALLAVIPDSEQTECVRDHISEFEQRVDGWARFRLTEWRTTLKDVVDMPGMQPMALQALVAPFSATVAKMSSAQQVTRHFAKAIDRVKNASFVGRRSGSFLESAEYLFDAFSARQYVAEQWGGPYCRLMASKAGTEVGDLRDWRYVVEGLQTEDSSQRMRVIAGLAFLGAIEAAPELELRAINDVDEGVRVSALWALGFLTGQASAEVVRDAGVRDPSSTVQRKARNFEKVGDLWWWRA